MSPKARSTAEEESGKQESRKEEPAPLTGPNVPQPHDPDRKYDGDFSDAPKPAAKSE